MADPTLPIGGMPPNMGVDYDTLARLSATSGIVPGGNPAGNIGTAGQAGYLGHEQYEHEIMMQQAMQQAELDAQLKRQQASEYMAGAPGREAQTQVSNTLAQARLGDVPTLTATQSALAKAGLSESQQKQAQAELDKVQPYANLWVNSQGDPEAHQIIREKMKADGITRIGNKSVDEITDANMDGMMNHIRDSAIFSPSQIGKERIAGIQAESRVQSSLNQALGRIGAAQEAGRYRELIAQHPEWHITNPEMAIYQHLVQTVGQDAAANWYQTERIQQSLARGNPNAPQPLDIDPAAGTVTPRPMVRPQAVPLPQPQPGAAAMATPPGVMGTPPPGAAPTPANIPGSGPMAPPAGILPAQAGLMTGGQFAPSGGPPQLNRGGPQPAQLTATKIDPVGKTALINGHTVRYADVHRTNGIIDAIRLPNGQVVPVNGGQ